MLIRTVPLLLLLAAPAAAAAQAPDSVLAVSRSGESLFRVNVDGKVGIGNSDPSHRLTVRGGVRADSVVVDRIHFTDGSALTTASMPQISVTYEGNWTNFGDPSFASVTFSRDPHGVVRLEGMAVTAGGTPDMFVLPPTFRPRGTLVFAVYPDPKFVHIQADGLVTCPDCTGPSLLSLSGINFVAAQ